MSDLTQLWCRICALRFNSETSFKEHMSKTHVESELPYRCEICHYATSFYFEIINHFNKVIFYTGIDSFFNMFSSL